jgi:hypothetical protein
MIFSKPEVESNYVHSERFISRGTSRVSSARGGKKAKAIILIQKRLRGYCARVRVNKQIELKDYLENKRDFDDNEKVGQGLKMSDLSMSPGSNFKIMNVKRNQMLIDTNMISELKYNPAESKLENSQSILIDFFNKNGAKNTKNDETSNLFYIENTCRNYNNEDERDLNKNEMNFHMHDSPLTRILPEDEISIISSRIETNRKGAHNTTFEILNSTRKNKLKDESVRIVESIKKNSTVKTLFSINEEEYDVKNTASYNFKKYMDTANKNPATSKSSLNHIKKNQSENKIIVAGKFRDSLDVVMKTHKNNAQKELMGSKKDSKKRPGSAGLKLNKPLDIAKMNASLRLLKKKTANKSHASNSSAKENSHDNHITGRGPVVKSKIAEQNLDASKFKRPNCRAALTKKKEKSLNKSATENSSSSKLLPSPKMGRNLPPESPRSISRMRRVFGSEKMIRQQLKRAN